MNKNLGSDVHTSSQSTTSEVEETVSHKCTHCQRCPREEVLQWPAAVPSCDKLKPSGTYRINYYDKF